MDGVIVLDKPGGVSSHGAVQRMRKILGVRRIGHLGTLDPLGTGVLPLVVGKATRLSQFFLNHEREYEATIRCGFATTTYDCDGEPTAEAVEIELSEESALEALECFRGRIQQTPPPVSAKKIRGVRAYKLARRSEPVELDPVEIEIYDLALLSCGGDSLQLRIRCSAGTYVRSLAHDLGRKLGVGAHVAALRRTAIGQFSAADALTFERIESLQVNGRIREAFVAPEALLPEIPVHRVDAVTAGRIAHGRDFSIHSFDEAPPVRRIKAIGPDGRLLAIGEMRLPRTYHPIVVF